MGTPTDRIFLAQEGDNTDERRSETNRTCGYSCDDYSHELVPSI
ncbi:hypothetical protein [Herbiconiux sp. VKM Ac-2851]|nr:hypothetical protein [Herbiconiux sp. VKM Ac-2851]